MSKTIEESLAFASHVLHGRGLIHFEAVLGMGNVPEAADFLAGTESTLERCEEFLKEVASCCSCLQAIVSQSWEKLDQAQAAERASYLPGLEPEDSRPYPRDGSLGGHFDREVESGGPDSTLARPEPPRGLGEAAKALPEGARNSPPSPESVFRTAQPTPVTATPVTASEPPKRRGPGRPSKAELAERERVKAERQAAMPLTNFTPAPTPPRELTTLQRVGPPAASMDEWDDTESPEETNARARQDLEPLLSDQPGVTAGAIPRAPSERGRRRA